MTNVTEKRYGVGFKTLLSALILVLVIMGPLASVNSPTGHAAPNPKVSPEQYPFPHNVTYPHGIMPSLDRDTLNRDMLNLYTKWRDLYLTSEGTKNPGEIRVRANDGNYKNGTPSEGIGFGMLISVYMANSINSGHNDFDGLYRYYKSHLIPGYYIMSWKIDKDGNSVDPYSAPDGDIDVALALLMAHKQWGSKGEINYKEEAHKIMSSIMEHLIYKPSYIVKKGIGTTSSVISSYEIPAWFKLFGEVTGDERWDKTVKAAYDMLNHYYVLNPNTGLVPYQWSLTNGVATYSGTDTNYGFDSSRVPWRVGQDFLWNGTSNSILAHDLPDRNVKWFIDRIDGKPETTRSSYNIDGSDRSTSISPRNMVGPMAVAAMVDSSNQATLDLLYNYLRTLEPTSDWPGGYYQDAVLMMSMLVLTGNMPNFYDVKPYPKNELPAIAPTDTTPPSKPVNVTVTKQTYNTIELAWDAATDDQSEVTYEILRGPYLINVTKNTNTKIEFLDPGKEYTFTVRARDAAGNKTSSEVIKASTIADTIPPAKTTGISAKPKLDSIMLGWRPASDNDTNGNLSYDVYANDKKVNTEAIYFTGDYLVNNLNPATTYNFKIVAKDRAGNTSTSDVFTASTTATDVSPPTRPLFLKPAKIKKNTVTLKWEPSTDDDTMGTVTYDVYNGSEIVNPVPLTGTSFKVKNLEPRTEYVFKIVAKDAAGNAQEGYVYEVMTKKKR
jgi:endo-1,4-beta-D-glucanase Y